MKFFFKRILPNADTFRRQRFLQPLLQRMPFAQIWQVNRFTIAGGVAVGAFFGNLPIPAQTFCAAAGAMFLRVNMPIAVIVTFYSNPLTMTPLSYLNYRVGAWVSGISVDPDNLTFTFHKITKLTGEILLPLFTGSVVLGLLYASISYLVVRFLWWIHVRRNYRWRGYHWLERLKMKRRKNRDL